MRDFTRMFLRVAMFVFLLVGCGTNIAYLGVIAKKHPYQSNYNSSKYGEPIDIDADEEYIEDVSSNDIKPIEEEEFPDYNRTITRY